MSRRPGIPTRVQAGFTLVELLLAVTLLSILDCEVEFLVRDRKRPTK